MSSAEDPGIAERIFGYRPNNVLPIVAAVVYGTIGLALSFRVVKSRAWWGSCLPIGSFFVACGFLLRSLAKYSPNSLGLLAIEETFIICAPAAFLAFNYITYGHLISYLGAEHSIVNPGKVARIFVISDICTFLMQASGSGLQTSAGGAKTGQKITLVGLVLQAISYGFFCILLIKSHISIGSHWASTMHKPCLKLIWVLHFSSTFIVIRCIYRVIEYAQGYGGYLLKHEAFLYALDTLPLILAITPYIRFWPVEYIEHDKKESPERLEMNTTALPP